MIYVFSTNEIAFFALCVVSVTTLGAHYAMYPPFLSSVFGSKSDFKQVL